MGANFDYGHLPSDSQTAAAKEFRELQEDRRYEYGHRGYTGTFAEARGVSFSKKVFKTQEEAYDYVSENAEKWSDAIAVKIEGKPGWFVGAWCSS